MFLAELIGLFCNNFQEFLVKNGDRVELMAMLGIFGGVVSGIQMYPWLFDLGKQPLQLNSIQSHSVYVTGFSTVALN